MKKKKDKVENTEEKLNNETVKNENNVEKESKEDKKESVKKEEETIEVKEKDKKPKKNHDKIIKIALISSYVLGFLLIGIGIGLIIYNNNKTVDEKDFKITNISLKSDENYVANNDTFIVETNDANEEMVKKHLYIEPPVNYEINKVNKNKYEVEVKNVPSDTLVNLSLVKNEVKSYSWAFQSTKDLKVLSVYPAEGSSSVPTNTAIYITMSYPDVTNLKDHFEIFPEVDGEFTQIGRVWRFTPTEELQNDTTYTITITRGVNNGEYSLEESYKTTFSTYNRPQSVTSSINTTENERKYKHSYITFDKINDFTPDEYITFRLNDRDEYQKIKTIKLYKFENIDEFYKFLNNENDYQITDLGEQEFDYSEKLRTYTLKNLFDEGYYVEEAYLESGEVYTTIPVQVNKLSAFMFASDDDLFLWVGSGSELVSDVPVALNDRIYKTGSDGTLKIENYNKDEEKIEYLTVGDTYKLIIGVNSFYRSDYPKGYIYTDKPIYKNTDTVRIWGYIPLNFYKEMYPDFRKDDFILECDKENIPIEINDDGSFITKYELDNQVDGYKYFSIKYKNIVIANRSVNVSNYSKENYEYDIDYDKNYINYGENFDFKVHVRHVSGIDVANKTIIATYENNVYEATTDAYGDAYFSIPSDTNKTYDNVYYMNYISVKTGEAEFGEKSISIPFYTVKHLFAVTRSKGDSKTLNTSLTIRNLSLDKDVKTINSDLYTKLDNGGFEGNVNIKVYEIHRVRQLYKTYFNEYTRKTINSYTYPEVERILLDEKNVTVQDGNISYTLDYELKKNTDEDHYEYLVQYVISNGEDSINYSNTLHYYDNYDNYENGRYFSSMNSRFYYSDYSHYRYFMNTNNINDNYGYRKFSINDGITFELNSYDKTDIPKDSKVLRIEFKNRILDTKIFNYGEDLDTTFTKDNIPGIAYVGALFTNGKFYRLPSYYYDYNEEDSKLNIDIEKDKEEYSPGEKVHLKIKVKDKDDKGVESRVIVSIVDKAVFNVVPDSTNILSDIYTNLYYRDYTFSSYRDYEMIVDGGGAGNTGGENTRVKFSDTIYFDELKTNSNGEVELDFELNDSVTSFVVTVHAITDDAYVGVNKEEVVSTLPLAISVLEPRGLKVTDDIVIGANSVGKVTTDLTYTFELVGTDKVIEQTGLIGQTLYANFGKLEVGTYRVKISATDGNVSDAIEFPFEVKATQQEIAVKATSSISELKEITPTKNPIILEFYKPEFSKYITYLDILSSTNEDRLDTRVSYFKALEYENKYYGKDYPVNKNDMDKFNNNGVLRYLENDENSLLVTALVNYYSPDIYKLDKTIFYEGLEKTTDYAVAIDNLLVLASMKEPILDELKYIKSGNVFVPEYEAKIALAYAFLGDYDNAKLIYEKVPKDDTSEGILSIVSTFIDKDNSEKLIDELYQKNAADRCVYFAMLSYFMNNETDLSKESTITVKYGDKVEEVKLSGLMMKKISINNKDLATLSITSDDENDMINYYYEGGIKEVAEENIKQEIEMYLDEDNLSVGKTVNLVLNVSSLSSGNIKVYLPNSLKVSGRTTNKGAYISANRGEYIVLYLGVEHDDVVSIPLYVTYPGEYNIEEVVMKVDNDYYISNALTFNVE